MIGRVESDGMPTIVYHRTDRSLAGLLGEQFDRPVDVVECPDCGADNELGYRYCRSCVAELPTAMAFERDADGPLGRLSR